MTFLPGFRHTIIYNACRLYIKYRYAFLACGGFGFNYSQCSWNLSYIWSYTLSHCSNFHTLPDLSTIRNVYRMQIRVVWMGWCHSNKVEGNREDGPLFIHQLLSTKLNWSLRNRCVYRFTLEIKPLITTFMEDCHINMKCFVGVWENPSAWDYLNRAILFNCSIREIWLSGDHKGQRRDIWD